VALGVFSELFLASPQKGGYFMRKKLLGFAFVALFAFTLAAPLPAQDTSTTTNPPKQVRWEGTVIRVGAGNSTIQVRQVSGNIERTIYFDSNTIWNSQYHDSKNINKIDASQVKEGDRVICVGSYDAKNEFHATTISKRLSHSPK
jgi:hypothetical protein